MENTLLTQIFSRVGKYVIAFLLGVAVCISSYFIFPPLRGSSGVDNSADIESIRSELSEAIDAEREALGEIYNLRATLKLRDTNITELEEAISFGFSNNLEAGDLIMEAGITADESRLLIREIRRRIDKEK